MRLVQKSALHSSPAVFIRAPLRHGGANASC